MVRAFWFALKLALIVVVAIWVASRPGTVAVDWLGYEITAHVGFVLVGLLIFIFVLLFFHRFFLALAGLPGRYRQRKQRLSREKGYRALVRGLSAVTAGDARQATIQAQRTRKYWPDDKMLAVMLEAQSARLSGDHDKAQQGFSQLMDHGDSAFLGLRGLMSAALEDGQLDKALFYARKALKMHPHQPQLLHSVYDLELALRDWDSARLTLKAAVKHQAIPAERAQSDRLAMAVYQADLYSEGGQGKEAQKALTEAHKSDPGFVPAALRLARLYQHRHKRRKAVSVIEAAWRQNPHPELARLWGELAPENKPTDMSLRLRWFEKLVALRPDSAESQMAAAHTALEDSLTAEARQYLDMAAQLCDSPRLYRLEARFAEKQGRMAEAAHFLERAAEAPPDDVWYCRETGRIYDHWTPVALPHGSFNTIIWGQPKMRPLSGSSPALAERSALLLKDSGFIS